MFTTIIFLIVLAVLIFVHELGHFLSARFFGIRVDEFALGFGPKIFKLRKNGIDYSLRAVPFGGYVKIYGENPDDVQKQPENITDICPGISFIEAKRWQQAIVLFAGVAFNFIFAFILFTLSLMIGTVASSDSYAQYSDNMERLGVFVTAVNPGSPAYNAGIKSGDVIKSITTKTIVPPDIKEVSVEGVQSIINESAGAPIVFNIKRGEEELTLEVIAEAGLVPGKDYAIGIGMDEVSIVSLPPHYAIYEGFKFTGRIMWMTVEGFYNLISGALRGEGGLSAVTGPIGIAGMVGDAARLGIVYLMMFTGLISVNLGIINLVPFPALDGGRLLIVGIESILRRSVMPKAIGIANVVGFFILMTLMVIVTWRDIANLL